MSPVCPPFVFEVSPSRAHAGPAPHKSSIQRCVPILLEMHILGINSKVFGSKGMTYRCPSLNLLFSMIVMIVWGAGRCNQPPHVCLCSTRESMKPPKANATLQKTIQSDLPAISNPSCKLCVCPARLHERRAFLRKIIQQQAFLHVKILILRV